MTPPNLAPTPATSLAGLRLSPSALVLVAANLVPLAGVLFFGWSVFATLLLFWVENVIVGGFNVLRMLWAQPDNPLTWVAKAGMIPFFIVHYGMFTTVHGLFVLTLFGKMQLRGLPGPTAFFHAVQGAGMAGGAARGRPRARAGGCGCGLNQHRGRRVSYGGAGQADVAAVRSCDGAARGDLGGRPARAEGGGGGRGRRCAG